MEKNLPDTPGASALAAVFGDFLKRQSGTDREEIAAVGSALVTARNNGDSYILPDDASCALIRSVPALTEGELPLLVLDGRRLYLNREYRNETSLARNIANRLKAPAPEQPFSDAEIVAAFQRTPNEEQKAAVKNALQQNFSIISGGPGTGKTTIIAALVTLELKRDPGLLIEVAAPTGKAAELLTKGLAEACPEHPVKARTLHALFKARPDTGKFGYNSISPLECDLLIVDECSMISLDVAARMFEGLKPETRVVFSGDHRQLEAIGSGAVLSSLLNAAADRSPGSEKLQSAGTELTVNYRSRQAPAIQALARAVRERVPDDELCEMICRSVPPNYIFRENSPDSRKELLNAAFEHWKDLPRLAARITPESVKDAFGLLKSFRIITAMRVGSEGCARLNQEILSVLGIAGSYAPGSALMITRTCRRTGLANGDVGIAFTDDSGGVKVCFEDHPRPFPVHELPEHESAFAMTVHKAQGSGFQEVYFPMPQADTPLLTRELFYTALTRAALKITISGGKEQVLAALGRECRRATALTERLLENLNQ